MVSDDYTEIKAALKDIQANAVKAYGSQIRMEGVLNTLAAVNKIANEDINHCKEERSQYNKDIASIKSKQGLILTGLTVAYGAIITGTIKLFFKS